MVIRTQLQKPTSVSIEKHWDEMLAIIQKATDFAKATTSEYELFIENVAKDARAGASFVAINQMLEKVAGDSLNAATPLIKQFSDEFARILVEATSEVIVELLQEKLAEKLRD